MSMHRRMRMCVRGDLKGGSIATMLLASLLIESRNRPGMVDISRN